MSWAPAPDHPSRHKLSELYDLHRAMTSAAPSASLTAKRLEGGRRHTVGAPKQPRPLISIITVVLNGALQLRATVESVLQQTQTQDDIEYIVIDGGSTDGTVDVLRSFDSQLDYWLSEGDSGIYDAMNKGISLSRGQFVYHLNIGDQLVSLPSAIRESIPDEVACIVGVVQTGKDSAHRPSAGVALRFHNTIHHQGCFYRNAPDLRYDLQYRVFADFDLNQRLCKSGAKVLICPDLIAIHDQGGISHTTKRFAEVYHVVRKNHGLLWLGVSFAYFKSCGLMKRLGLK